MLLSTCLMRNAQVSTKLSILSVESITCGLFWTELDLFDVGVCGVEGNIQPSQVQL